MSFLYSFVTTKPCVFRSTYLHFIISTFLAFHGAHKSRGILFNIKYVKFPTLFYTLFNAQILSCSMVLYHYSNILTKLLIHLQPIHPRFLCGWPSIFVCVVFQHLLLFVGSDVIIIRLEVHLLFWDGLDIPYYQIQTECHHHQLKYLSIVRICFRIFWNLHLVVFAPFFILKVTYPTSVFQKLWHILTCFIPSFRMACCQFIISSLSM